MYKRQVLSVAAIVVVEVVVRCPTKRAEDIFRDGFSIAAPVSYTHLDVYKRQEETRTHFFLPAWERDRAMWAPREL